MEHTAETFPFKKVGPAAPEPRHRRRAALLPLALSAFFSCFALRTAPAAEPNVAVSDLPDRGESSEETLVTGPDGTLVAVWTRGRTCCHDVSFDGGKTWGKDVCLEPMSSGMTGDPGAGVDEKGNFYITCQDYSVSQIRMSSSLDGGKTWNDW